MSYTDISKTDSYPKTLVIRNTPEGIIWQTYHVQKKSEAEKLSKNATANGFFGITLEDYRHDLKETWPDWRENAPHIIKDDETV